MKSFYLKLNLVCLLLGLYSCSQEDDLIVNNVEPIQTRSIIECKSQIDANSILVHYLYLDGDQYKLSIDKEKASLLGVAEMHYENVIKELENTNKFIKEAQLDPNNEVELSDPQEMNVFDSDILTNITYVSDFHGKLDAVDQYEVQESGKQAPEEMAGVEFMCRASAAITPGFICGTCVPGGNWIKKTKVGFFLNNTTIQVPITLSRTTVSLSFQTTDANGGFAVYQGYKMNP